jgi:hypothetical protein
MFILFALLFAAIGPAHADSWAMPETTTYVSANGQYRLTVVPRQLDSQLGYFEAKARGDTLAESKGPTGRVEQLRQGNWVQIWSRPLVNEVAPVRALAADDGGRVVTFDNWHSTGFGVHVVVIYGADGALVRSLRLDQIVPAYFVDALPRSVSSIQWRGGDPRFVGDMIELAVSEPRKDHGGEGSFVVRIALADGRVEPIAPETLAKVGPDMCAAHADSVRNFNAYLSFERGDLIYTGSGNKDGWQRYLANAVERLRPREAPKENESGTDRLAGIWGETTFELLDSGAYMEDDFRDQFRSALAAPMPDLSRRWFASRDQDRMVAEIERTAKKIKAGQLVGVDMYFFADGAHWQRIRDALAASGAQLVQVDPAIPIPPRSEVIAALPPERTIDPACTTATGSSSG